MGQGERVDLAVIGGGVAGLCVAFEAARSGHTVALFEREPDFAVRTSANWFRILHGGLRYLQSLDLIRHRESVEARREWLRDFPDLMEPLPCLMPLTGRGLKRPSLFRTAFAIDAALAHRRNHQVRRDRNLPNGRVLSVAETRRLLPQLSARGLQGAALWTDAIARDARTLIEALVHRGRKAGARLYSGDPVHEILVDHDRVRGIRTRSGVGVAASAVVNATGPWTDITLSCLPSIRRHDLFRPSLAFNLVLNRPTPFDGALAVQANRPNAPVLFVYPHQGRMVAGTWHAPWLGHPDAPQPSDADLQAFVDDLADALPWLDIRRSAIEEVQAGLMPVEGVGSTDLLDRPVLVDHGREGGPRGLFTTVAIKFTTAPSLARRVLSRLGR